MTMCNTRDVDVVCRTLDACLDNGLSVETEWTGAVDHQILMTFQRIRHTNKLVLESR
jgi:hypothetical protein